LRDYQEAKVVVLAVLGTECPLAKLYGPQIQCIAHFDNSEVNLNNPDPTTDVRWGDQTWEEMIVGYFDVAVPKRGATTGNTNPSAEARLR
jgi:hypothetical protein